MRRILWNKRSDDIDEIVVTDVDCVHIEQMGEFCWWIGIDLKGGGYWAGNFHCPHERSKRPMSFTEQEREGFDWDEDAEHLQ